MKYMMDHEKQQKLISSLNTILAIYFVVIMIMLTFVPPPEGVQQLPSITPLEGDKKVSPRPPPQGHKK